MYPIFENENSSVSEKEKEKIKIEGKCVVERYEGVEIIAYLHNSCIYIDNIKEINYLKGKK
jgi:hypothetical protein